MGVAVGVTGTNTVAHAVKPPDTGVPHFGISCIREAFTGEGPRAITYYGAAKSPRHLSQEIPATPGIRVIDIPFPLKDAFDASRYLLASQQTYPQFTGNKRNLTRRAVLAITRFTSLDQVHNVFFASTHSAATYAFGG